MADILPNNSLVGEKQMPDTDKIDLNSADVALLTQLPGVAKNVAYDIVNYRERHGGFSAWEDLQKVRSLPQDPQFLQEIQSRAYLGPRPQPKAANPRRVLTRRVGKSKDELHNRG